MGSVTRTQNGSRARRRDEIRRALLEAVEELLAEESFTELSVERIVRAAGMSRSTFYVYFEDKGDLLRALTTDVMTDLIGAAGAWWTLPPSAGKSEIRAALSGLVDVYRRHRLLMAAAVEASTYDASVRAQYGALVGEALAGVQRHFAEGQREGSVDPSIDTARVAEWLTWMTERGLLVLVAPASDDKAERLLDALTDIVWNAAYAGAR